MAGSYPAQSKREREGFRCAARRGKSRCRNYTKHLHGGVQVCYEHWLALRESIKSGLDRDGLI